MTLQPKNGSRLLLVLASLLVAFFLLMTAEIGLRMAGFRFDTRPRYMEFNFPNPKELHEIFVPDSTTFWKLKPGEEMGEDIEPINSKGFRGPEFAIEKTPGVTRVVALGDSVTFGGAVSYPQMLAECLGNGYEVINAGVPGYSLFQGLRMFESRIARVKPDIVTVMFGWNDHWYARGYPDSRQQVMGAPELPWPVSFVRGLCIFQLLHYAVARGDAKRNESASHVYRVPMDEYRALLGELINKVKASNARAVLLTTPSALDSGKVPDYLFGLGFIRRLENEVEEETARRLRRLHGDYNDIVREAASKKTVPLLDLESKFYKLSTEKLFRDPSLDVVHPNEDGYRLIGDYLCDTIKFIQPR